MTRNMFSISRFQALMKQVPRSLFDRAVQALGADKHRKGFSCWSQLQGMVFAQLSAAQSLRTVVTGFNAQASQHYHLNTQALRRSTLADANAHTDPEVFASVARALMGQLHRELRQEGGALLSLVDSTSITLKGRGFDAWTFDTRTRNTQGLKVHVQYTQGNQAPSDAHFTPANVNDIEVARGLPLQAGTRYVFDKGYTDYSWWKAIGDAQALFVTRFKYNAALLVEEARAIPGEVQDIILCDEIVRFRHRHNRGGHLNPYQASLRRITVHRDGKRPLLIATNDLESPAAALAEHYKARWGIELFFKWIKQHLHLKNFLGRSQNAVKIQILTALIAYLLVALYRQVHAQTLSLWECLALLRTHLFQRPAIEAHHRAAHLKRKRHAQDLARQGQLAW